MVPPIRPFKSNVSEYLLKLEEEKKQAGGFFQGLQTISTRLRPQNGSSQSAQFEFIDLTSEPNRRNAETAYRKLTQSVQDLSKIKQKIPGERPYIKRPADGSVSQNHGTPGVLQIVNKTQGYQPVYRGLNKEGPAYQFPEIGPNKKVPISPCETNNDKMQFYDAPFEGDLEVGMPFENSNQKAISANQNLSFQSNMDVYPIHGSESKEDFNGRRSSFGRKEVEVSLHRNLSSHPDNSSLTKNVDNGIQSFTPAFKTPNPGFQTASSYQRSRQRSATDGFSNSIQSPFKGINKGAEYNGNRYTPIPAIQKFGEIRNSVSIEDNEDDPFEDDFADMIDFDKIEAEHKMQKEKKMRQNVTNQLPNDTPIRNLGSYQGQAATPLNSVQKLLQEVESKKARRSAIEQEIDQIMTIGQEIPEWLSAERQSLEKIIPLLYKQIAEIRKNENAPTNLTPQQESTRSNPFHESTLVSMSAPLLSNASNLNQTSYSRNESPFESSLSGIKAVEDSLFNYGEKTKPNFEGDLGYKSIGACGEDSPLCEHNIPSVCRTSRRAGSAGRRFYCCSKDADSGEKCNFFEWIDFGGDCENGSDRQELDIFEQLRTVFGHHRFRHGQEEVVRASMRGRDLFVLIPTGGGKSLCYQLPAVCCPGLSVVFSPLNSLVHDQVQSLKLDGVKAASMGSDQNYQNEIVPVMDELYSLQAFGGLKLLYLTPEKIDKSPAILKALRHVYNRGLLSRFVIDEAHCLSGWGYDFRPDYRKLNLLREEFPKVPIMALTATADKKVIDDAVRILGLRNHVFHKQSFNRPNLEYAIRKKSKKIIDEIADVILRYPEESGIVYCLSRRECEVVADQLSTHEKINNARIKIDFYHAERTPADKKRAHTNWTMGRTKVICATIAFGMGINKIDVRYVIHHSVPKSLTNLYQESGRAGRDGKKAECIIFFSFGDKNRLESMIKNEENNMSWDRKQAHLDDLNAAVSFCDNEVECRRVLLLGHFGEPFLRANCNSTCDNCRALNDKTCEAREADCLEQGRQVLRLATQIIHQGCRVTLLQLSSLWRGEKHAGLKNVLHFAENLPDFGAGKNFSKSEAERIVQQMILLNYLDEDQQKSGRTKFQTFQAYYVNRGKNANLLEGPNGNFKVMYRTSRTTKRKKDEMNISDDIASLATNAPGVKNKENSKNISKSVGKSTQKTAKKRKATPKASKSLIALDDFAFDVPEVIEVDLSDNGSDREMQKLPEGSFTSAKKVNHVDNSSRLTNADQSLLMVRLKRWTRGFAEDRGMASFQVLNPAAHDELVKRCPVTIDELKQCEGFSKAKVEFLGASLVSEISSFVSSKGIALRPFPKPAVHALAAECADIEFTPSESDEDSMEISLHLPKKSSANNSSSHFSGTPHRSMDSNSSGVANIDILHDYRNLDL